MSKERARRRAEREAQHSAAAEQRRVEAERRRRSEARRQRLTGWLPSAPRGQSGILAEKRRRQVLATAAVLVVVNLLVFAVGRDHGISALLLVASLLGAPILHLMMFRRT